MNDIVVDRQDAIGIVRINRPDRGNSVTPAVVTTLGDVVEELCTDTGVRALVLIGTGRVFCAGADVQEMHDVYRADGADGLMAYLGEVWMPAVQRTVRKLWSASKPTVAAFNGSATAGGLDFGLTCDRRIAAQGARFAESYVNLGMVPVAGGAYLLPSLVGQARATEMLASGRFADSDEALQIGLVDELCAPASLLARACEVAAGLAHGPMATFAAIKHACRLQGTRELEDALTESLRLNIALIAGSDVRRRTVEVMEQFA